MDEIEFAEIWGRHLSTLFIVLWDNRDRLIYPPLQEMRHAAIERRERLQAGGQKGGRVLNTHP